MSFGETQNGTKLVITHQKTGVEAIVVKADSSARVLKHPDPKKIGTVIFPPEKMEVKIYYGVV